MTLVLSSLLASITYNWDRFQSTTDASFMVAANGLYGLYLAYAAARLAGGSVAVERQRQGLSHLLMLPVSAWDIFIGKLLGSLLPLFVEVVLLLPAQAGMCLLVRVPATAAVVLALLQWGVITWFGLWGIYWSVASHGIDVAIGRARMTVTATLVLVGLACLLTNYFDTIAQDSSQLLNPLASVPGLMGALAVVGALLAGATLQRLKQS